MRVLHGFPAAKQAVLARTPLEDKEVPEVVQRRLAELFGVESRAKILVAAV